MRRMRQAILSFWIGLYLLCLLPLHTANGQTMIEPHAQAMPLLPFLDYIIDTDVGMGIDEVVKLSGWEPFVPDKLPMREGTLWLRFTIAPLATDARPQTFLLDMGQSVPGTPVLYEPIHNPLSGAEEWRPYYPGQRNIFLLPEATTQAVNYYICIQGLPGPWFAPMIRSPQDAASNWGSLAHTGAMLALGVVMGLCLLRGLGERGEWRYWIAIFVAVALLQAWLGMPAARDGISIPNLMSILAPGLALLCLGHAGRHLLRNQSRSIDLQLFALSLSGAALAILPLVPGFGWLDRWLDLWPLTTIIYVPTALAAWLMGLEGAKRFLWVCFIPPLFTGAALLGLDFGLPANILASGPAWGVAVAALLLAAAPATSAYAREPAPEKPDKNEKPPLPEIEMEPAQVGEAAPHEAIEEREDIINLDHPLDDPNLRFISPVISMEDNSPREEASKPKNEPPSRVAQVPSIQLDTRLEERENALRKPLDALIREVSGLANCSLPPSARQFAEDIQESAKDLAQIMSSSELPPAAEEEGEEATFNLQRILRNAHDSVSPVAEYSGIALSWFMPPHLPQIYEGHASGLETTLAMLMESSVRSSRRGAVKVSVKRVPDSADASHLLFTVTDEGQGYPPLERSSLALARAWEFTGRHGGYLSVETSQHGATISFTAHFEPVDEEDADGMAKKPPVITIVSDNSELRRQLVRILGTLPCQINEAETEAETIALQEQKPAHLLVTQGKFAMPASADMIRRAIKAARNVGIKCSALALTLDASEWGLLKASGFTHAILEPVDPEILRGAARELIDAGDGEPETTFYSASTELIEPIKVDDKAPSMLIEQTFPIISAFEGPDWLGEKDDKNKPEEEPEGPTEADSPRKDASELAYDGVAARMPVEPVSVRGKEIKDAGEPVGKTRTHAPLEALEWVGEPMPVPKPTAKSAKEEGHKQAAGGQLLDFIVGVQESANEAAKPKNIKPDDKVKEFVEGSVDLVASTISDMLRQKEQPPAEQATAPIQARSDPAIIALVDRLDVAMKHANAALAIKDTAGIAESTAMIAQDADNFGLRLLSRMAKCVERAATKGDMAALVDLLPELGNAVERNRIALSQRRGN